MMPGANMQSAAHSQDAWDARAEEEMSWLL